LQFVQDKVRYMAIEFGPNSHRPSSPSFGTRENLPAPAWQK
jgi:hypothetical protein